MKGCRISVLVQLEALEAQDDFLLQGMEMKGCRIAVQLVCPLQLEFYVGMEMKSHRIPVLVQLEALEKEDPRKLPRDRDIQDVCGGKGTHQYEDKLYPKKQRSYKHLYLCEEETVHYCHEVIFMYMHALQLQCFIAILLQVNKKFRKFEV